MQASVIAGDGPVHLAPLDVGQVSEEYVGWLNDPLVRQYTEISGGETTASVTQYVAQTVAAPDAAIWRIVFSDGVHVGNIRLSHIRWKHRRAEVAILIGSRDHWSRGVATNAIRLLTEFAWTGLKLHKLTAGILAPNVASRRAFEKAGYSVEAVLREHAVFADGFCDVLWMANFALGSKHV